MASQSRANVMSSYCWMLILVCLVAPTLNHASLFLKRRIERHRARLEAQLLNERTSLRSAVLAIHADVFPLDAERSLITYVVQRNNDLLEVDVAVTETAEIPVASRVAEVGVPTEHAHRAVAMSPPRVLHVNVIDAVTEPTDELHVIDSLIPEVRWIVVEPKLLASLQRRD